MEGIMPNRGDLWRAVWPAALVGVTWIATGVAWSYPGPLLVLVVALISVVAMWPDRAGTVAAYLSFFAVLAKFSQPLWSVLGALLLVMCAALALVRYRPVSEAWLLAGLALSLSLANFSGGSGSANGWEEMFRAWLHLSPEQADLVVKIVRKCIHFTVYGSIAYALAQSAKSVKPTATAVTIAIIWVAGHAGFDELRQWVTPGRTGSPFDFALDLAGAATFLTVFTLIERMKS